MTQTQSMLSPHGGLDFIKISARQTNCKGEFYLNELNLPVFCCSRFVTSILFTNSKELSSYVSLVCNSQQHEKICPKAQGENQCARLWAFMTSNSVSKSILA